MAARDNAGDENDYTVADRSPAGAATSPGGFVRWIEGAAYALVNYLECRAAVKTLRELDDRALKDIGIARCQIEAAVDGTLNPDMARLR